MSKTLAEYMAQQEQKKADRPELNADERRALHVLRREARALGAWLKDRGRGGLSPSLVLGVFRRDKYRCTKHGDRGEGKYGGLTLHHKGGIVDSPKADAMGHSNDPKNLEVVCELGHDELHEEARRKGIDSSQVTPEGDK